MTEGIHELEFVQYQEDRRQNGILTLKKKLHGCYEIKKVAFNFQLNEQTK